MKLGRLRKAGPLGIALTAAQVAWTIREHWQGIPADRRERLQEFLHDQARRLQLIPRHQVGHLMRAV